MQDVAQGTFGRRELSATKLHLTALPRQRLARIMRLFAPIQQLKVDSGMLRMILRALWHSNRPTPPIPSEPPRKPVPLPPRKADGPPKPDRTPTTRVLKGKCYVVDGDTIVISSTRIRIAGIDAPELHHPWGKNAKSAMIELCKGKVVTAEILEDVSYDRIVARCYLPDGTDLAAELVKRGLAIDWPRFSGGAYRHLEPEGIRKKHWRATAKQRGKLKASDM